MTFVLIQINLINSLKRIDVYLACCNVKWYENVFNLHFLFLVRSSEPMFRQQYQYWKMYSENFFCYYLAACTRTRFWSVNICGFHLAKNLSYIQNTLQNFKIKCTRDSDVSTTLVNQELCTCHPRWLSILLFWV